MASSSPRMGSSLRDHHRPHFTRGHGLGNDYLVIEPEALPDGVRLTPASARLICDRHRGVGSDGILELRPSPGAPARFALRIWNPDGSTAEKSGNGIRIFAKYLRERGHATSDRFAIDLPGGAAEVALNADLASGRVASVTVAMGIPTFDPHELLDVDGTDYPVTILSIGNPHCVVAVPDLDAIPLHTLGPAIERHRAFPERTNVQFATPVSDRLVRALVWERGAGETMASGSSACAVAAACHRLGVVGRDVTVSMPGGDLLVHIARDGGLWLSGPAEEICTGHFSPDLLARLRAFGDEG